LPQGGEIVLRRYDPLVPGEIGDRFWDTGDPRLYLQRLPVDYVHLSSVAMEATGISDFNGYFQKRKEWLQLEITDTLDPVERETLQVRLRVLDAASQTFDPSASPGLIENRLGLQCIWEHPIRGEATSKVRSCSAARCWPAASTIPRATGTRASGTAAGTVTSCAASCRGVCACRSGRGDHPHQTAVTASG
jgi:hypothetical protein